MKKNKPISKIYSEALKQIAESWKGLTPKPERYPGDADFQNKFGVYGSRFTDE